MSEAAGAAAAGGTEAATAGNPAAAGSNSPASNTAASSTQQKSAAGASAPPAATNPTKAELKDLAEDSLDQMVTIKVNGQSKKVSVREALKQAELGEGAQTKMQQAAQVRKQAERLYNLAKTDPAKFLIEIGQDPDKYATEHLTKKYERMAMTPEQKKAMETQEKLQTFEQREQAQKNFFINQIKSFNENLPPEYVKALENATPEQLQAEVKIVTERYQAQMQAIEKEFLGAWEKSGLPRDSVFGTWMASLMHSSQVQKNAGQRERALSAEECAAIVKDNFLTAVGRITAAMDAQSIHQLFGPETMKKLREYDIQRVTGSGPEKVAKQSPGTKPASQSKTKTMNEHSWKNEWAKLGVERPSP